MTFTEYQKKWGHTESDNNFAAACLENGLPELHIAFRDAMLDSGTIESDCEEWGISTDEWFDGVKVAIGILEQEQERKYQERARVT